MDTKIIKIVEKKHNDNIVEPIHCIVLTCTPDYHHKSPGSTIRKGHSQEVISALDCVQLNLPAIMMCLKAYKSSWKIYSSRPSSTLATD